MFEYDRISKWLISRHADSILRLGGLAGVASWRALPGEVVAPRRLPDGLVEFRLPGEPESAERHLALVEINSYPDRRVPEQLFRGLALTYLHYGRLPEVLSLVLRPKGRLRVEDGFEPVGPLGRTRMRAEWRSVEVWTLRAGDLLSAGDPGLIPWSTLAEDDRPPDRLFGECRDRIEAASQGEERLNLLAATQVLASLKFGKSSPLLEILGGSRIMIESPLLEEWGKRLEAMGEARGLAMGEARGLAMGEARGLAMGEARGVANARREDIRRILGRRFGAVPADLSAALEAAEAGRLETLLDEAVTAASLEDFRRSLA